MAHLSLAKYSYNEPYKKIHPQKYINNQLKERERE